MIHEKITSVSRAIGVLAGQVTDLEQQALIRAIESELADAAETAQALEAGLGPWCIEIPQAGAALRGLREMALPVLKEPEWAINIEKKNGGNHEQ